jgi:choline kinase
LVKHCIILAAGINSRLPLPRPKSLILLSGETLLERHIRLFASKGIKWFTVVAGNNKEILAPHVAEYAKKFEVDVRIIVNPDYKKQNGYSVYHALKALEGSDNTETLLTMGDHYFSESFLDEFLSKQSQITCDLVLAVDIPGDTNAHIDLEDVTKVKATKHLIADIGKEISDYSLYDTGLFKIKKSFYKELEVGFEEDKSSISDGVHTLIKKHQAGVVIIENHFWNDIDTPLDLETTERLTKGQS